MRVTFLLQGQSICERQGAELGAHQPVAALPPESPQSSSKTNNFLLVCFIRKCYERAQMRLIFVVMKNLELFVLKRASSNYLCQLNDLSSEWLTLGSEPWSGILV